MITYDEALKTVREKVPNWLIRTVNEFNNEYYFHVSPGNYFSVEDVAILMMVVSMKTGKTKEYGTGEFVWKVLMNASDDYVERYGEAMSLKNTKPVDLTSEQWQEYVNYRSVNVNDEKRNTLGCKIRCFFCKYYFERFS